MVVNMVMATVKAKRNGGNFKSILCSLKTISFALIRILTCRNLDKTSPYRLIPSYTDNALILDENH